MTSRLHLNQLRQYLNERSRQELIAEISSLYTRFAPVKEYYEILLAPDGLEHSLAKHKEIISNEFFPHRGFAKARLSVAKKAITDFAKLSSSSDAVADLMLLFVETGVEFTSTYGDIDESFYRSLVTMYSRALKLIFDNDVPSEFIDRCQSLIRTLPQVGFLFAENMNEIHAQYFV